MNKKRVLFINKKNITNASSDFMFNILPFVSGKCDYAYITITPDISTNVGNLTYIRLHLQSVIAFESTGLYGEGLPAESDRLPNIDGLYVPISCLGALETPEMSKNKNKILFLPAYIPLANKASTINTNNENYDFCLLDNSGKFPSGSTLPYDLFDKPPKYATIGKIRGIDAGFILSQDKIAEPGNSYLIAIFDKTTREPIGKTEEIKTATIIAEFYYKTDNFNNYTFYKKNGNNYTIIK